jgi:hypothetical protein
MSQLGLGGGTPMQSNPMQNNPVAGTQHAPVSMMPQTSPIDLAGLLKPRPRS